MRIRSLPQHAPQPACRLSSQAFDAAVDVVGLSAAEMAWLFGYPGGKAFAWTDLRRRGRIRIALAGEPPADLTASPAVTTELSDGRVECRSGHAAILEIGEHHDSPGDRFARSLNLALSQQWARAGLMVIHAAGVVVEGHGSLVLGPKASGKSTLTAAVLAGGGRAVSDDWMLMGIDEKRQARMERMRGFLMLRRCWASDRLLGTDADLGFRAMNSRPKYTLSADARDERFPLSHPIEQICLLRRIPTRPCRSERFAASPQAAMAALIAASMPLLFSADFPLERTKLGGLVAAVASKAKICGMVCGIDIPDDPSIVPRLLAAEPLRTYNRVDAGPE